jgi:hypothetical protein
MSHSYQKFAGLLVNFVDNKEQKCEDGVADENEFATPCSVAQFTVTRYINLFHASLKQWDARVYAGVLSRDLWRQAGGSAATWLL